MSRPIEFFVRIEIGNDYMKTSADIAESLRAIARRLEANQYLEDTEIQSISRGIMDANGNTVGEWGF